MRTRSASSIQKYFQGGRSGRLLEQVDDGPTASFSRSGHPDLTSEIARSVVFAGQSPEVVGPGRVAASVSSGNRNPRSLTRDEGGCYSQELVPDPHLKE